MAHSSTRSTASQPEVPNSPPFYPARPLNGGPLERARPKSGQWYYEPKINGWRALVHLPTGSMFNRRGQRLSIESEFGTVLHVLEDAINDPALEWLDCEALERRIPIGKGSLIVLDAPLAPGDYVARQQRLYSLIEVGAARSWAFEHFVPEENSLLSFAYSFEDAARQQAQGATVVDPLLYPSAAWTRLQQVNRALGCELFEGLVAKRADSPYPIQLRSPDEEFTGWVKHRWKF